MNTSAIVRSPLFWITSVIMSLFFIGSTVYFFPKAFPIVNLTITMNRSDALQKAEEIMHAQNFGPQDFQSAVSFESDSCVKTFVELENGKDALTDMLNNHLYEIYYWHVRHFKEHEVREASIYFAPDGTPYGFNETLSQDEPGASLSVQEAQSLAEDMALQWDVDLSLYKQVEASHEVMPGGRTDHTFVYERTDITAGEGLYRLRVDVKGDKVCALYRFVKVPEAFNRKYEQMRSANNTIALTASFAMYILYIFGGCLIGLFFLYRKNWVLFKPAFKWGIVFGIIAMLKYVNNLPLYWMYYSTSIAMTSYILQLVLATVLSGVYTFGAVTILFAAAEGLTRLAFGNHIQFTKIWETDAARSLAVAGRTVGAFLLVSWELFFVIIFYLFTTKYLGWWTPSESLIDPNILATYIPFLNPLGNAFFAGFIEECLFRAVPLASAALLGRYYNREKLFIGIAFIAQILIFSAAHANYPMQPAYARVIELIIPSCTFGALYLFFGLLPAIITHVVYDAVLMSLPLFVSNAAGAWIHQVIVTLVCLLPIWVILFARYKGGAWHELASSYYNRSWLAIERVKDNLSPHAAPISREFSKKTLYVISASTLFLAALIVVFRSSSIASHALPLTISRTQAIDSARTHLTQNGVTLDAAWTPLASIVANNNGYDHRFIWQEGDTALYDKLSAAYYLTPPAWSIRFVQFEGNIVERAREYQVLLAQDGTILQTTYQLPESDPGATLSKEAARDIAHTALQEMFALDSSTLNEISATAEQHPARKNWTFVFANPAVYPLEKGQARIAIVVSGDKVTQAMRYVFVPEEWQRPEYNKETILRIITSIGSIILMALFIGGIMIAILAFAHGSGSIKVSLYAALILAIVQILHSLNNVSSYMASFSTSRPFASQLFQILSSLSLGIIMTVAGLSIMIGYMYAMPCTHRIRNFMSQYFYSGYLLGACAFIIRKTLQCFLPSYTPTWAQFNYADAYFPAFSLAVGYASAFMYRVIILYAITACINYLSNNGDKNKGLVISLICITSFAIGTNFFSDNLVGIIGTTLLFSLFMSVSYYYFVRYDIRTIALAIGSFIALSALEQAWLNAFIHARFIFLLSSIGMIVLSYYWAKKMLCAKTVE